MDQGVHGARFGPEEQAKRLWSRVRKLLFGDWHPLLRDPLDLIRLSFAVAAAAFLLAGQASKAFHLFLNFLILVAAQRLNIPRRFELLFILGWERRPWATLRAYST